MQNPVQENLNFSFTAATSTTNEINVYNLVGTKVYTEKIAVQKGTNSLSVKLNSYLTPGTYILVVKNNTTHLLSQARNIQSPAPFQELPLKILNAGSGLKKDCASKQQSPSIARGFFMV